MTERTERQNLANTLRYNHSRLRDLKGFLGNIVELSKKTRDLFTEAINSAYADLRFQKDQLALLPKLREDPAHVAKTNAKHSERAQRQRTLINSAFNCLKCQDTGQRLSKFGGPCTCEAGQTFIASERKRLFG